MTPEEQIQMIKECDHPEGLSQGSAGTSHNITVEYCDICGVVTRMWTYDVKNEVRDWVVKECEK